MCARAWRAQDPSTFRLPSRFTALQARTNHPELRKILQSFHFCTPEGNIRRQRTACISLGFRKSRRQVSRCEAWAARAPLQLRKACTKRRAPRCRTMAAPSTFFQGHATHSDTGELWAESRPQLGKRLAKVEKGLRKHISGLCGITRAAIEFPVKPQPRPWYFPWLLQINMEVILGVDSQALSWSQVQQPSRRNSPKHCIDKKQHTGHLGWRETCLWVLQCFMDMAWNGTRSN